MTQLRLKYQKKLQGSPSAAFIKGKSPLMWLSAISRILPEEAGVPECYLLPVSRKDVSSSGIFIISEMPLKEAGEPYCALSGKLYIPAFSKVWPDLTERELEESLLYDIQLFHPVLGMVGFDKKDAINLVDLLEFNSEKFMDWSLAQSNLKPKGRLTRINVEQPSMQDIIDEVQKEIGSKPLSDINKDEGGNFFSNLLKGAIGVSESLKGDDRDKDSMFNKFENWAKNKIDDLQAKREAELNRLLEMFSNNIDEALKYAPPLDSKYMGRGSGPEGWKLFENMNLNFNLGGLGGGGGSSDKWGADNHYHKLRKKYQEAAKKALAEKQYRKAAYIYAHLLNDFNSAANALEQGHFYREAALVYKEHLKNKAKAAECLEKGGLYLEAIELYEELKKYEKCGDLYTVLENKEAADHYFQLCVDAAIANMDFIEAARLQNEKMAEREKAMESLLLGWRQQRRGEACLSEYFDLFCIEKRGEIAKEVLLIYKKDVLENRKAAYLNVMQGLIKKYEDEELKDLCREMAYEIISEEVVSNNKLSQIHDLKKFIQDDRLIAADSARYVSRHLKKPKPRREKDVFQLDKTIEWFYAISHHSQFLVLGKRNNYLQLARGNWYGDIEYYSWGRPIEDNDEFILINSPFVSNQILLWSMNSPSLENKKLPKNKYFGEALEILFPLQLQPGNNPFIAAAFVNDNELAVLRDDSGVGSLAFYNNKWALEKTKDTDIHETVNVEYLSRMPLAKMIYRNEKLYALANDVYLEMSLDGLLEKEQIVGKASFFDISIGPENIRKVVVQNDGQIQYFVGERFLEYKANIQDVKDVRFLSSSRFAVINEEEAIIYQCSELGMNKHRSVPLLKAKTSFIKILPTNDREKIAFLESGGKIWMYLIP